MPFRFGIRNKISTLDEKELDIQWPRFWIIICGIILIFLCLSIAGMEIGNTVSDLRRATAFGGFILFPFLLACAVLVLITAFKPSFILRRNTLILCIIMIILCLVLIAYDIVIVVDPTRCFFFDCNGATVNATNSTTNITVSGWPLNIPWPNYFQTNMNAKRILQGIQLFCAFLFMLFASLFILTYFIYQIINRNQRNETYNADQPVLVTRGTTITPIKHSNDTVLSYAQDSPTHLITTYTIGDPAKHSNDTVLSYAQDSPTHLITTYTIGDPTKHSRDTVLSYAQDSPTYLITTNTIGDPAKHSNATVQLYSPKSSNHLITTYIIDGRSSSSTKYGSSPESVVVHKITPRKTKKNTYVRSGASSVNSDQICTRCQKELRIGSSTIYARKNYFSHLCVNCNQEIFSYDHKSSSTPSTSNRTWKY